MILENSVGGQFLAKEIFDDDVLEKILKHFATVTGMCYVVVDRNGVPISEKHNFSMFCKEARKSEQGKAMCRKCDSIAGQHASITGRPYIYKCHNDLIDFAVPIIVLGNYVGAILSGQVILNDFNVDNIIDSNSLVDMDEKLLELREANVKKSYQEIEAIADMLYDIANHIADIKIGEFMQEELNRNNMKLAEETNRRLELEKTLKDTELRALQSQVNPHFLFNVLNTISRLAIIENAKETEETIYSFSELMRYTLKRKNRPLVEFKDEISHLENYLNIQKTRLRDRLQYKINIEEGLEEILCPFMTIQPMVENCINHVVEKKVTGGKIDITVKKENNEMVIFIKDNGDGIAKSKIKALLRGDIIDGSKNTGIGIFNVNQRLIHNFGQEYKMKIISDNKVGKGTAIVIRIPIIGENYV